MKSLTLFFIPAFLLGMASCNLKTYEGEETTEKRSANKYQKIAIRGPFKVSIDDNMSQGLTITAPSDAMADITTQVEGEELVIDLDGPGFVMETFEVKIAQSELSHIKMYGSGYFSGNVVAKEELILEVGGSGGIFVNSNPKRVRASVSGSGFLEVSGETEEIVGNVSGSGGLKLEELSAKDADLQVSGSGFISAHVDGKLKALVSGSGSISYTGNPTEIDKTVSGSGSIDSN